MTPIEVAKSEQVREGAIHVAHADGRSIALTRVAGNLQAFENKCPHLGLPLTKGKIEDGHITCPWHSAKYELCSGHNLQWVNSFVGVKMPEWSHGMIAMGKKPAGLHTFTVSENNGAVYVTF